MTLIEIVVVVAIMGAVMLVTMPSLARWSENQRLKGAVRSAADLLMLARSEAIRTGNPHVVFFGVDPDSTMMTNPDGGFAPVLALNDGTPAAANCRIDGGETWEYIPAPDGISWGVSYATSKVPSDTGGAVLPPDDSSGSTFRDPNGTARMDWVMFRPDGIPIAFDGDSGDCGNVGAAGAGGGGLYVTNGKRDYAGVLSPLGSVRVHVWRAGSDDWSS
jgi:type II secretory pathway pseudopilin PulG